MADYVLTASQLYPEDYACRGGCGRFTEWPDDWCEECDTDDGSDGSDDDWPCIYPGDDNHMSDPLLDIAAQAMYTQDAQDSMSSASWQDLAEGERDEWRRIAEAGIAALRDHLTSEDTCRRLTHARMSYYGCTIDQITAAEQPRQHTDACERTEQGWHCYDEHDRSLHPLQDTLDEAAEQIRWVLDQIGTMHDGR